MKIFAGLEKTDYQDLLRAVGALLDEHGLRDIRMWEHEDGLVLQGRTARAEGHYLTHLLTDEDLHALLQAAYRRRGIPGRPLGGASQQASE